MSDNDKEELNPEEQKILDEWQSVENSQQKNKDAIEKELDQNEIDNVFGFSSAAQNSNNVGIKAMIDKALDTYEKLPMLEVVFEKFIRQLSISLRNLTEANVELEVKSIQSLRFGNYINSLPLPSLVNVFKIIDWDHYGIFIADSGLIYSLVDILFGGKKADRPIKIEGRPYTSIEQSLVKQLVDLSLSDLSESFSNLSKVTFAYERMESDPRFASITRPSDSTVLVKIGVEIEDKKGSIEIVFPYEAFEPIYDLLTQVFIGEKFGADATWQQLLISQLHSTTVELKAVLDGRPLLVNDITKFEVGSTIMMNNDPEKPIDIECNGIRINKGKLGKIGKKISVQLESAIANVKNSRKVELND